MNLPESFILQMQNLLGEKLNKYLEALDTPSPISIRLNSKKKISIQENYEVVKWNSNKGIYLKKRPIFTLDPRFHAGAYYVQEASSMFINNIIKKLQHEGDKSLKVLDLCAAPGGKSTSILDEISDKSLLISNEVIQSRYNILKENLSKWGNANVVVCNHDPKEFKALYGFFDIVLVDAPCSGEGLFRKDQKAIEEWSSKQVEFCSARQKRILVEAVKLIKPGGKLIYSTCTYNSKENDENSAWIEREFDLTPISLSIPEEWRIKKTKYGYQFYPHLTDGEGFYCAIFQQPDNNKSFIPNKKIKSFKSFTKVPNKQILLLKEWIQDIDTYHFFEDQKKDIWGFPKIHNENFIILDNCLRRKRLGLKIGQFKRTDFIPSHELALSPLVRKDLPSIEVNRKKALLFLKKENIQLDSANQGWHLIRYKGLNLGWVKILKNRVNNYYPKNWRILMTVDMTTVSQEDEF